MTMTSWDFIDVRRPMTDVRTSFSYAKTLEDHAEHFVLGTRARNVVERAACWVEICEHELPGHALTRRSRRALERRARLREQRNVAQIRYRRALARQRAAAGLDNALAQLIEPVARERR